ncbi:MAG: GLUG motif-containing protein [Anaerohalosphaeraceae bacterium]
MYRSTLAVAVALLVFSTSSLQAATYGGGGGTAVNPYQIWTPGQLNTIGANSGDWTKHFILMADIDMSAYTGSQYRIIGNATTKFTGSFDGNGYVIKNLTYTTGNALDYVGLFGWIESATIQNLGVESVSISSGGKNVGSLVGRNYKGLIIACYATGSVSGNQFVGGLAGYNYEGSITSCYAASSVSGDSYLGGLVGRHYTGSINACYATGAVTGNSYVGGLIGRNYQGKVICCYSTGKPSGSSSTGGLCGEATVGGKYEDTGNFWDTVTSETLSSVMGTGKITAQMKVLSTFLSAGWDFVVSDGDPIDWWLPNNHYPRLSWEVFYGGGSGAPGNPYQIWTADQMNTIGANPVDWASHFKLMVDIDMSIYTGTQYRMIGNSATPFTGSFDGNRHVISNLTYTTANAIDHVGVFGFIENAVIQNLGIENISFSAKGSRIGGLVGENAGTLTACYVTGSIDGTAENASIGGLAGLNRGVIAGCYMTGSVSGTLTSYIGGLVGSNHSSSPVADCYASALLGGEGPVGGLAGYNAPGSAITACFWDTQVSGQMTSAGGTGKTTVEMKTQETFIQAGWDFLGTDNSRTDWAMPAKSYPRISWEFPYGEGDGTAEYPYQIWTAEQMNTIGANSADWSSHFKLMADIDMSVYTGTQYRIIGNATTRFTGTFDGNGHVIRNLSYTTGASVDYIGLFGWIENAAICNLNIEGTSLSSSGKNIGGLAGRSSAGSITACHAAGLVSGTQYVGGLVGWSESTRLSACSCSGTVSGTGHIGGLVGRTDSGVSTACCSVGVVHGTNAVGGLVGGNYQGTLLDCYTTASVDGTGNYLGGMTGYNNKGTLASCYAAGSMGQAGTYVGGLIGWNSAGSPITACFWDTEVSGKSSGSGGGPSSGIEGKTTVQMQTFSTFTAAGWDFANETANGFDDFWRLCSEGTTYPRLNWQSHRGDYACPDGVYVEDLTAGLYWWLGTDCSAANNYCGGSDLDYSGAVDLQDYVVFSAGWLSQ